MAHFILAAGFEVHAGNAADDELEGFQEEVSLIQVVAIRPKLETSDTDSLYEKIENTAIVDSSRHDCTEVIFLDFLRDEDDYTSETRSYLETVKNALLRAVNVESVHVHEPSVKLVSALSVFDHIDRYYKNTGSQSSAVL